MKPINEYFAMMQFETTHFVFNSGSNLELWMVILSLGIFSWGLYSLHPRIKSSFFKKIIIKIDTTIRYKFMIRSICISFLYLSIAALIEVRKLSWIKNFNIIVVNLLGIIGVVSTVYIPIKVFDILFKNHRSINDNVFLKRYKTFLSDLNPSNVLRKQYSSIYFF